MYVSFAVVDGPVHLYGGLYYSSRLTDNRFAMQQFVAEAAQEVPPSESSNLAK